jgi:hypothetical protein
MTRSERRYRWELAKARAKRIMRTWFGHKALLDDPRIVAQNAETHCRPCGCFVCTGGFEKRPTRRLDLDQELAKH